MIETSGVRFFSPASYFPKKHKQSLNSEKGRKRRDLIDMEGNPVSLNMTEILWVPKPAEIGRSDSDEEDTVRSEEDDFDRSEVFDSEFSLRSKEEAEERYKFLVKISQKIRFFKIRKKQWL